MLSGYFGFFLLGVLALVFGTSFTLLGILFGPKKADRIKKTPFETGLEYLPSSKNVQVKFYLVAMVFLIFDVEVAILYPYALILKDLGLAGLIAVAIFLLTLNIGILYEFKRKILKW